MKTILFIIALLFSFNAFAKVEIWKCERLSIFFYYKIDTKIPTVFQREKGQWEDHRNNRDYRHREDPIIYSYNKEDNSMKGIKQSDNSYVIFDLLTKELAWWYEDGSIALKRKSCEVINP